MSSDSRSLRSGKKSIFSAFASFAAVLNEKLTSRERTLVMYGRETFMRLASSVWETPSCFIRRRIRRKKAEPIWSIVFIRSQGSGVRVRGQGSVRRSQELGVSA